MHGGATLPAWTTIDARILDLAREDFDRELFGQLTHLDSRLRGLARSA